jgi:hypothetical protein
MYPLAEDQPGQRDFAYDTYARHAVFPPGVTAEMIAANPEASRPDWVKPRTFWADLGAMLDFNPQLGPDDTAIGDQARALVTLYRSNEQYRPILDRVALSAYAALHDAATYAQAGLDAGNGWRRQPDRSRGGFWSLTMYNKDIFMLADSPNGRVNLGTVNLDAGDLAVANGKLTLHLSHDEPADPEGKANWLPAPADQFCLAIRAYVPGESILNDTYQFPDVIPITN